MNQNIFENTMAEMTWPEIEALAAEGALVLLPVGVIEEHGEHLPLGTDTYLAYAKARDIVAGMQELGLPCVIAPSYCFGVVSTVTKNFPGSFTAKPEHVQSIITDILESIENAGFKNVLLTNVHGDGVHISTIIGALKKYNQTHSMNARWLAVGKEASTYGLSGAEDFLLSLDNNNIADMMDGLETLVDPFDVHAGAIETAIMMEKFPELVRSTLMIEQKPTMLCGKQIEQWMSGKPEYEQLTPAGHVGDPSKSSQIESKTTAFYNGLARNIAAFYGKNSDKAIWKECL